MKNRRLLGIYLAVSMMTMAVACGRSQSPTIGETDGPTVTMSGEIAGEATTVPSSEIQPTTLPQETQEPLEGAVAEQMNLLMQNLAAPEYAMESVSMLFTEEWFDIMAPDLETGKQSYCLESEDATLYVEVGYGAQGQKATFLRREADGKVMIMEQTQDSLQQVTTGMKDGKYQGAFESWICIASTGDVFFEKGTFEQGVLVGEYTAQVKWGRSAADILALWNMREGMEMDAYEGYFDEKGMPTVMQPILTEQDIMHGPKRAEDAVVYAYDEAGEKFLFMNLRDNMGEAFTYQTLGMNLLSTLEEGARLPYENRGAGVVNKLQPTEEPKQTENPRVTEEPKQTESPQVTEEPKQTEVPQVSQPPQVTEEPQPTQEPEVTPTPTKMPWGPDW